MRVSTNNIKIKAHEKKSDMSKIILIIDGTNSIQKQLEYH